MLPSLPEIPEPDRAYLDNDILTKLTAILAKGWEEPDVFLAAAATYAAMRQVELLVDIAAKLGENGPAIANGLSEIDATLMMLTEE